MVVSPCFTVRYLSRQDFGPLPGRVLDLQLFNRIPREAGKQTHRARLH
jgi:hypothetical protein